MQYKQIGVFENFQIIHTGTAFGEVHPNAENFSTQINRLLDISGSQTIVAQKLGFNCKVTLATPEVLGNGLSNSKPVPNFLRTKEVSDGIIIPSEMKNIAVCVMNADCNVVEVISPAGDLAVLHLGLNNLDVNSGTTIIGNAIEAFKTLGFEPNQLKFRVGEGAQSCCYGLLGQNPDQITSNQLKANKLAKVLGEDVIGTVSKGPRKNGIAFNIPLIAARIAEQLGLTKIEIDQLCTSCHHVEDNNLNTLNHYGTWFSNLRECPEVTKQRGFGSRNALLVFALNQSIKL
ncbi:laccase domain-containing protein [Candidatus Peregrinibacteria bacterium]|nr:laccase domain-containing protein [Candidatus Peregrinibacteria bacterium]